MKRVLRQLLLGFLIWSAYNVLNAGVLSLQGHLPYRTAWQSMAVTNYVMALLSIPLWYVCVRFPFSKQRLARFFLWHLVGSVLFTVLWLALSYALYYVLSGRFVVRVMFSQGYYLWQFLDGLTKYGLLVGIFYTLNFYKKFKEKELRETELSLLTKKMELQNLKAQLNPHFLFNALNSVNALISREPEKARTMNAKLAQLLRVSLEGDERKFNTLKQELAFVRDYLAIEKVRFGDKLRVHEEIDPGTLETRVPGMILQPIIENAIKHGISRAARGGDLTLKIYRADGLINLEISNTGKNGSVTKGVTQLFQKGIGLRNTHERLKRIYGDSFGLRITAEPGLFSVKISIPQNHAIPE